MLAPAESLAQAPTAVPLADAAALPLVGLTAWQALFDHAELKAGQRILISGAGGAVGGYAVQLANGRIVTVKPGLYADDMVEVEGEVHEGDAVVTAQ